MNRLISQSLRGRLRQISSRINAPSPVSMVFMSTNMSHQNSYNAIDVGQESATTTVNLHASNPNILPPDMSLGVVEPAKDVKKTSATSATSSSRLRKNIAPIIITEKAAVRIKDMISNANDKNGNSNIVGVKLGVKRRGCNGYSYTMNYATDEDVIPATKNGKKSTTKYEIVQDHGVTIAVDPKAVFFIVGTKMDWSETELASEFVFINPNIKGECGCGESFNI